MTLFAINGSHNMKGKTSAALEYFLSEIRKFSIKRMEIASLEISPCRGCLQCRPDKTCILPEDDGHKIGRLLEQSDLIVIGSPTYWGNIPGTLKSLFDRNVTTLESFTPQGIPAPRMNGKKAVLIITSGAPWPFNLLGSQAGGAVRALKTIVKASGMSILKTVNISSTDRKAYRELRNLADRINTRTGREIT